MNAKTILLVLITLLLTGGAHAAKCKFETQQVDHVESRRLILFRGATVGLGGHFGMKNGEYYLRGLFGSNFKARAMFTADTPLELTLADDRVLTLDVVTEAISSKLRFGHIITASREAEPVFSVTAEQWSVLQESPIVSLHMSFDAKGERQSETRDVKSKHAQRIMAALECVTQEGDAVSQAEPTP
jgi:hypothetical protein